MRENFMSGSMRGGWKRRSEALTTYAPAGELMSGCVEIAPSSDGS